MRDFFSVFSAVYYLQRILYLFWIILETIIRELWWLIVLFIAGTIFLNLQRKYKKEEEKKKEEIKDWVTLEIVVNPYITSGAKAMEQVFSGIYSLPKGYVSLELVGIEKEIRFFVRVPRDYKGLVLSQFYAQYPDLEIKEVQDYFLKYPPSLPDKNWDIWGTEMKLIQSDVYPIKTYSSFEETKEEKSVDTLSSLIEGISQLRKEELLLIQIIIQPLTGDKAKEWLEKGEKEINKLSGKKEPPKITWTDWVIAFFKNLLIGVAVPPVWPGESKTEASAPSVPLTKREVVQKISRKIEQLPFLTGIRLFYLAPKDCFNEIAIGTCYAFLNQFTISHLNGFKVNKDSSTKEEGKIFVKRRLFIKKLNFYKSVINRKKTKELFVLVPEELASVYHFPSSKVKSPSLTKTLFRKSEPPPNLPT